MSNQNTSGNAYDWGAMLYGMYRDRENDKKRPRNYRTPEQQAMDRAKVAALGYTPERDYYMSVMHNFGKNALGGGANVNIPGQITPGATQGSPYYTGPSQMIDFDKMDQYWKRPGGSLPGGGPGVDGPNPFGPPSGSGGSGGGPQVDERSNTDPIGGVRTGQARAQYGGPGVEGGIPTPGPNSGSLDDMGPQVDVGQASAKLRENWGDFKAWASRHPVWAGVISGIATFLLSGGNPPAGFAGAYKGWETARGWGNPQGGNNGGRP